jgi:uncharacterized Rossmann fold enzyme
MTCPVSVDRNFALLGTVGAVVLEFSGFSDGDRPQSA